MTDRPTAILILLDSILDYLPSLKSATGQLAASGPPMEQLREKCQSCNGSGKEIREQWDTGKRKQVACGECDGGWVNAGVIEVAQSSRGMDHRELDAEIGRLDRDDRERRGERESRDAYGWERARRRALGSGSYRDLERALGELREVAPDRSYRCWRYAQKDFRDGWSAEVWSDFRDTVELLSRLMPERLRVPEALRGEAARLVAEAGYGGDLAKWDGVPADVVAAAIGVTDRTVRAWRSKEMA